MSDDGFNVTVDDGVTTDTSTSFEVHRTQEVYSRRADGRTPETEEGDTSDEVEPRKLMTRPTINDIRWLSRTSMAETIVEKPVEDAFKNGFEVKNSERDVSAKLDEVNWETEFKDTYKAARRDGFALMYIVLEDDSDHVGIDPMDEDVAVEKVHKVKKKTLDDLARFDSSHGVIPSTADDSTDPLRDLDYTDYEIRPTGIVMDTDPFSETYMEPLGYLIGEPNWVRYDNPLDRVKFYHRNRFMHYTVNTHVDGDLEDPTLGKYEGDSVLTSSYHILRGLKKGNWSIMQTLFRYAAKLYHVELPEDADDEDYENATESMTNMNAKSELITPHGYEIDDFQTDGQLQPREYFDVLFDQVCASNEMTKSVLFGTQTGTVSGSETDIKNYFNKVERLRQNEFTDAIEDFYTRITRLVDGRASADYEAKFDIEWGPLFKLSELDNAERLTRIMQTVSAAVNDFILTPDEARSILQEEWSEVDVEWEDDFSAEEEDWLKTLNVAQMGAEAALPQSERSGNSSEQGVNGGQNNGQGRPAGSNEGSQNPATDALSDRELDKIADRVVERLESS